MEASDASTRGNYHGQFWVQSGWRRWNEFCASAPAASIIRLHDRRWRSVRTTAWRNESWTATPNALSIQLDALRIRLVSPLTGTVASVQVCSLMY